MELEPKKLILIVCAVSSALIGKALILGPTVISNKPARLLIGSGQRVTSDQNSGSERNYIRYTLGSDKSELSIPATKVLANRFGISVGAIFNANDQREQETLSADNHQIRIPLQPIRNP